MPAVPAILADPVKHVRSHFAQFTPEQLTKKLKAEESGKSSAFIKDVEEALGVGEDLNSVALPRLNDCSSTEEVRALHHKLVRFDCMIQDQYEDEFFISYLPSKGANAGGNPAENDSPSAAGSDGIAFKYYSELTDEDYALYDCMPQDPRIHQKYMMERGNCLGVSVPNLNDWASNLLKEGTSEAKKQAPQLSCLLKLYDENIGRFKLNEQVSFFGVLEFNRTEAAEETTASKQATGQEQDPEEMMDDFVAGIPNEKAIPHLHVMTCRPATVLKCSEMFNYIGVPKSVLKDADEMSKLFEGNLKNEFFQAGQRLRAIFKLILKGDDLASSFLLMNLLSKVQQRGPEGIAIGHFNINLTGLTPEQAYQLKTLLKAILVYQLDIQVTIDSLSNLRFQPRKNYETNQMEAGLFQMVEGTTLICDDTSIAEGQVKDNGVNNIKALAQLIEDQKVTYDFQYVQQDFPVSHQVLILSEGRSMFKNALHVPVKGDGEPLGETKFREILEDQDMLCQLRKFFFLLTFYQEVVLASYKVSEECSKYAQDYFIEKRQKEHKENEAKDQAGAIATDQLVFHQWLIMSKLTMMAKGENTLEKVHFLEAVALEENRKGRL